MKNAEQPNKNPGAIPETAGNSHVIEITWNRGAANAVTAEYDFPSKAVADAFVRGAKEALAAPWRRWFEVRHVTPPDPSLGPRRSFAGSSISCGCSSMDFRTQMTSVAPRVASTT
jgi:hypothetical protein